MITTRLERRRWQMLFRGVYAVFTGLPSRETWLWAAVLRGAAQRIYHVCDDTRMLAGDYLELAAELLGEASPPRLSREQLERSELSSMARSFLSESRRLDNTRMLAELGLRLLHPDVRSGLRTPPATGPGDAAAGEPPDRGPARPGPQA